MWLFGFLKLFRRVPEMAESTGSEWSAWIIITLIVIAGLVLRHYIINK